MPRGRWKWSLVERRVDASSTGHDPAEASHMLSSPDSDLHGELPNSWSWNDPLPVRYPSPDYDDPFAPLWTLRRKVPPEECSPHLESTSSVTFSALNPNNSDTDYELEYDCPSSSGFFDEYSPSIIQSSARVCDPSPHALHRSCPEHPYNNRDHTAMATSDGSTSSSMISLKSVSAAPTNVPYIIDLTTQEFRPTKATRQRKPVTPQRTKSPKATNADHLVTPTSNLQIFTIDAPRKVPQITVRRKPVSPASVERPGSGLDLTLSETSATSVPPPDSFARYMSAFADQSMHVQFNIPRNRPLSRPGTSRSFRAPRDLDVPSRSQLQQAALLSVVGQRGERISFGELFQKQKTLVIFIRHFWCPLCQDYMASVSRSVSPEMLKRAGVKLVIISNGSHKMIRSYRKIFRTPFQVYTDPTHRVYDALGMTTEVADEFTAPGGYVRHGVFGGIAMVVANALKVGMPVWERGGDISRLGGEFILGPGITCSFAHRMQNPRSHAPIMRLIAEVGVDVATPEARSPSPASKPPNMTEEEEMQWMKGRRRSLAALKARKVQRRGGSQWCGGSNCLINVDSKEST